MKKENYVIENQEIEDKEKETASIEEQINVFADIIIEILLKEINEKG